MTHDIEATEVHLIRRPGATLSVDDFALVRRPLPALVDGQFLVRNRYLSIDPVRRVFFANGTAPIGAGLHSFAIGEVIASRHDGYAVGDIIGHYGGLRDLAIGGGEESRRIETQGEPLHWHMGPLGIGGFFAYCGLVEVARARPGETVFISSAAGSVGSVAAQIARIIGCRVIGSVGSPQKCDWLRDVAKIDVAIDYKAGDLVEALAQAAPDGIDVYFDNVGGDHLDAALAHINPHGRVAIAGMVANYDTDRPFVHAGGGWTWRMMTSQVALRSFNARDHMNLWPYFQRSTRTWLQSGAMRIETDIRPGLHHVPQAFVDLLAGNTIGKTVVEIV